MEYDIAEFDLSRRNIPRKRKINVFPAITSVKSASATLRRAIRYMDAAGSPIITPLIQACDRFEGWVWRKKPDQIPKYLNDTFRRKLKKIVSKSEIEIISLHLSRIFAAIYNIQAVVDEGERLGNLPRYGDAVHRTIQSIHGAMYDWKYFQTEGEKYKIASDLELSFIEAESTEEAMRSCDRVFQNVDRNYFNQGKLYFCHGLSNYHLYLHIGNKTEIENQNFHRFYFRNQSMYYLSGGKETADEFVLTNGEYERILQGLLVDFIGYSMKVCKELIQRRNEFLGDRFVGNKNLSLTNELVD